MFLKTVSASPREHAVSYTPSSFVTQPEKTVENEESNMLEGPSFHKGYLNME